MQRAGQHLHSAGGLGYDLVYVPLLADLRHVIPFGRHRQAVRSPYPSWLASASRSGEGVLDLSGQAGFGAEGRAGRLALLTVVGRVQLPVRAGAEPGPPSGSGSGFSGFASNCR
jgi:hypothetical protein